MGSGGEERGPKERLGRPFRSCEWRQRVSRGEREGSDGAV